MAQIKHGTVVVTIDDKLTPPDKAGKMSAEEVKRIPKAPRGIGLVGEHTADAIAKAGDKFTPPKDITPAALREACGRADGIDQVIIDLEVILATLKQANLLFDAELWKMLRKVNDQVKAQAKYSPELASIFKVLLDFLSRGPRKSEPTEG